MSTREKSTKHSSWALAFVLLAGGLLAIAFVFQSRADIHAAADSPRGTKGTKGTKGTNKGRTDGAGLRELKRVVRLANLSLDVPEPRSDDQMLTSDERLRVLAAGDPVGTLVPALAGMPKLEQLGLLKSMLTWPDHKFLFQVPQLANARQVAVAERIALSEHLGKALVQSLEDEGYRFDLPAGYSPVRSIDPPADLQPPPPERSVGQSDRRHEQVARPP